MFAVNLVCTEYLLNILYNYLLSNTLYNLLYSLCVYNEFKHDTLAVLLFRIIV